MVTNVSIFCVLLFAVNHARCHVEENAFRAGNPGINNVDLAFVDSAPFSHTNPETIEADVPIILWWTGRLFPDKGLKQLNCPSATCYSTSNRKYFRDPRTYGFYFYGTDMDPEDMPLPRLPHHEWALYHEESPMNNYMLVHNTMLKLFNHTATFRRESDFPLTTQSLLNFDYITKRNPVSIEEKNRSRKSGLAPVLFAQSHCDVASDRERYVLELMKHIGVDSIGSCLHNKDIPEELRDPVEAMESSKFFDLISKYKFHLAFENAICKDYMTEKLFRPLHLGSVPIYRGSPLAKDWMPDNKSIIMADDFSDPKELAEFLKSLDENDEEYEQYLEYKRSGIKNEFLMNTINNREWGTNQIGKPDSLMGFECHICQKISERYAVEKMHQSDPNIPLLPRKMAPGNHMNCPQPYPSIGSIDDISEEDSWRQYFWVEDYWGSLDKAQALTDMLKNKEKDPKSFQHYWEAITNSRPLAI